MASNKIKTILVPFDQYGNMQHSDYRMPDTEYVDCNRAYEGNLIFKNIEKYSSNVTIFEDEHGRRFYMSQGEFERIIPFMVKGVLSGKYYFHKQGRYFSIRYLED